MDISFSSVDETSAVSGEPFSKGDRVWSFLYRSNEGFIERVDVLEEERGALDLEGPVICKWSHSFKPRDTSEAEAKKAALQSTDDIFLSLFEETEASDEDPVASASRDRLKFFLALQLERKRILRPLGRRRYKHMPTGREVSVPELEITPELLGDFQAEISMMAKQ